VPLAAGTASVFVKPQVNVAVHLCLASGTQDFCAVDEFLGSHEHVAALQAAVARYPGTENGPRAMENGGTAISLARWMHDGPSTRQRQHIAGPVLFRRYSGHFALDPAGAGRVSHRAPVRRAHNGSLQDACDNQKRCGLWPHSQCIRCSGVQIVQWKNSNRRRLTKGIPQITVSHFVPAKITHSRTNSPTMFYATAHWSAMD